MEADRQAFSNGSLSLMNSSDATTETLSAEIRELEFLWGEARSGWNDRVAEDFEVHVITPFHTAVRNLMTTLVENSHTSA